MALLAQAIGMAGVVGTLAAYLLFASGRLTGDDARYYYLNIASTLAIVGSLFVQWNLPSMITQVMWVMISIIGLVRLKRKRLL